MIMDCTMRGATFGTKKKKKKAIKPRTDDSQRKIVVTST